MTLAVEDANSKLFDVVTFADVDIEESVDDQLVIDDSFATALQWLVRFLMFNYTSQFVLFFFIKNIRILFR